MAAADECNMEHDLAAGTTTDNDSGMATPPLTEVACDTHHHHRRLVSLPSQQNGDGAGGHFLANLVAIGVLSDEMANQVYQRVVTIALDLDEEEEDTLVLDAGGGGGFRGVPASAAAVAGLEKRVFEFDDHHGGEGRDDEAKGCVICMEEFVAGDEVCAMPCSENHSFHQHCIAEWLGRSNVCPLCRHALPAEEQDMMAQCT